GRRAFARLERFPLLDDLLARERIFFRAAREDVRVTTHELVADGIDGVADAEFTGFLADARQEHRFKEKIAELFLQIGGRAALDRLEQLVGFLQDERTQRRVRLLAVPWTAV